MKKFLSILLAAAMLCALCVAFASCTATENGDTDVTGANTEAPSAEKKTLVMATNPNFPPYEFVDGEKIVGIDAEIAEKIAEKLDMELKIEDVEFGAIVGGVQTGKYDIGMAGMTVTEARLKSVNFSTTYATGVQVVIVKDGGPVASLDDLEKDGVLIGVQQDTTGDIYASDTPENGGYGEDKVMRYLNGADAVQALVSGKIQAVIIDNEPAKNFVAANEGLSILDAAWVTEDYAIAIAKENEQLLADVNAALEALIADGTVKAIVEKYIPAE